jgi:hypothetical protein
MLRSELADFALKKLIGETIVSTHATLKARLCLFACCHGTSFSHSFIERERERERERGDDGLEFWIARWTATQ